MGFCDESYSSHSIGIGEGICVVCNTIKCRYDEFRSSRASSAFPDNSDETVTLSLGLVFYRILPTLMRI